ncbi:MAG TPA: 50S ribosomal protein L23 [Bacteroidales bacterium]|nr:50S ribosomal protein L23 [Bacteroidales bacterium]
MSIIIKPVVTEKMTKQGEKLQRYGFIVRRTANKIEIIKAVEDLYAVKVNAVNTMNYTGKNKTRYTRRGFIAGRTSPFKKAIVTLAAGQTIDFYSNI